ncbi:binding-protein-dependent transporters inner membrane component [Halogeometricum pallidum JCM 14848]|uniref:Binding-protein-dependent transporters inner membrane component n=1 Tax=Halogeometricum pallidum JCM 14848 TaxID=1227487 RepID=M0CXV2_HALPD|nr:ABC transporter permease [Halogeometricum pallidum]ELZ26724.1 binding-protein-dependent transporters inner membrane component [Halogeometricum pallidum JCM 14848]
MGLGWYIARRVAWSFVVTFIIVSVTWGLLTAAPNPEVQQAAQQAAMAGDNPAEAQDRVRQLRGLDRPLYEQYIGYMTNIYTLNWGWSDSRAQPVTEAVTEALYYTVQYSVPWTLLVVTLGPLVGLYSSANQYSWKDHLATGFAFFGYAIPNFFFGIILLLIFGVELGWIPITYNTDVPVFSVENAIQLAVPVFVLVTGSIGGIMRVSRNESSEYMNADFVKTARAKGVSTFRIYARHVLRPTMVPLSTTMVAQLLALFTGSSILVEVVFSIPGLGRLLFRAIVAQDTSVVLGTSLFFVFVATIGNLLQDLVYTVLDPRISFDER